MRRPAPTGLPSGRSWWDGLAVERARRAFVEDLRRQPGVRDPRVVTALGAVERHRLIDAAFTPVGELRPATSWRALRGEHDPAALLETVYSMDQVVVQLEGRPATVAHRGIVHHGRPTGQSSGAGLLAVTLQDLRLEEGHRFVEVGACTGILSAAAALITRRQATGVEIDADLAGEAAVRTARAGIDVRMVVRDGLRGLPDGPWDRIAGSFAVPAIPRAWWRGLAVGGVLTCTVSTGAPGWHATAVVEHGPDGTLGGRLRADTWGHVLARGVPWLPVPERPRAAARVRSSVPAPPDFRDRGFWVSLAHLLPRVRRHWPAGEDPVVVLVGDDGSRTHIAPDGSVAEVWGPRDLWAEAEEVHTRWSAAGRPTEFDLHLRDECQLVDGGPGLTWQLPGLDEGRSVRCRPARPHTTSPIRPHPLPAPAPTHRPPEERKST
ncbi:protein-L-isoaspartate O-methyltransferase [Kitasatospora sp. NPDC051853]|uniref:protein-L-isoaspartate O-methyltransferase n=1 Tax=Kitasatospora sp. NPDC051853 TaxID=3364058 RepID=UPI003790F280